MCFFCFFLGKRLSSDRIFPRPKKVINFQMHVGQRSPITFTANKKGYSYSISSEGTQIANELKDTYSDEYRLAVREVSTTFPSLNASTMQKQIYKTTINSLEAYNE